MRFPLPRPPQSLKTVRWRVRRNYFIRPRRDRGKGMNRHLKKQCSSKSWGFMEVLPRDIMPYINVCVWVPLRACVCLSVKKHQTCRQSSCPSVWYSPQSWTVQQLEARKSNCSKGKHHTHLWSLVLKGETPHAYSHRQCLRDSLKATARFYSTIPSTR